MPQFFQDGSIPEYYNIVTNKYEKLSPYTIIYLIQINTSPGSETFTLRGALSHKTNHFSEQCPYSPELEYEENVLLSLGYQEQTEESRLEFDHRDRYWPITNPLLENNYVSLSVSDIFPHGRLTERFLTRDEIECNFSDCLLGKPMFFPRTPGLIDVNAITLEQIMRDLERETVDMRRNANKLETLAHIIEERKVKSFRLYAPFFPAVNGALTGAISTVISVAQPWMAFFSRNLNLNRFDTIDEQTQPNDVENPNVLDL